MLVSLLLLGVANASLFDFIQNQFMGNQPEQHNPHEFEANTLNSACLQYLCRDTLACVATPNDCPCPFPSSQLRCVLPDGYICISKPAGDILAQYDDPNTNMDVDAHDDAVRDCGWVRRAYNGQV
jgi:hypothetical protein